jgi:hypothetical protein
MVIMIDHTSLLPPPLPPSWATGAAETVASNWCSPDHPLHLSALLRQRVGAAGHQRFRCWVTRLPHPREELVPVVVWVVDPLSQLIAATGVALVERRLEWLLSGNTSWQWFVKRGDDSHQTQARSSVRCRLVQLY